MCCVAPYKKGEYQMKTWFEWMDEYYEPFVQEISDEKKLEPLKKREMENLHERKNFMF